MFKILSTVALVLLVILTPPAVLAFVSQNAVPGDLMYPIKRNLEDGVLFVASANPTTKAWFAQTRSERRFQEASVLLQRGRVPSEILDELVVQTAAAQEDIKQMNGVSQKQRYYTKLTASINQYDQRLSNAEQQFASPPPQNSGNYVTPTPPQTENNDQQKIKETRIRLEQTKQKIEQEQEKLQTPAAAPSTATPKPTALPTLSPTVTPKPVINNKLVPIQFIQSQQISLPTTFPTPSPIQSLTPEPTQSPIPTITPSPSPSVICYDNYPPVTYQAPKSAGFEYYWNSKCSKSCSQNSDCAQNTSDPNVDPSTSNWCYGGRCYMNKTRSI